MIRIITGAPNQSPKRTSIADSLQSPISGNFHTNYVLVVPVLKTPQNVKRSRGCYNVVMAEEKKQPVGQGGRQVTINLDSTPILYTDNVMVSSNEDGVVFDFCQRVGSSSQIRVVARVGMSREHAKKLLIVLKNQVDKNLKTGQTGNRLVH